MKKLLIVILILSAALVACPKSDQPPAGGTSIVVMPESNESVLIVSAVYFEKKVDENEKATFTKLGTLPAGSTLTLRDGKEEKFKIGTEEFTVAPATLKDGKEVYVTNWYILPKQRLGVIKAASATRVYSGLGAINATTSMLPRGTIIGAAPLVMEKNPLSLQRIVCLKDRAGKNVYLGAWKTNYVASADVSVNEDDLKLAETLAQLPGKDRSLWESILTSAIQISPNSVFVGDARLILSDLAAAPAGKRVKDFSAQGRIIDTDVNLRSLPDENQGNVIAQLTKDDRVVVTKKTEEQYTVKDSTDYWYEINRGGQQGWVFGAFLEISNTQDEEPEGGLGE